MIYSLSGKLVHTESDLAVIECAGVGYACKTTFSTLQQIAGKSEVKLYTHLAVKEDFSALQLRRSLKASVCSYLSAE